MSAQVQEVTIGEFFKHLALKKKLKLGELAKFSGRYASSLNTIDKLGGCNTKILTQILEGVGEDFVIKLKDGQEFKIIKSNADSGN